MTHVCVPDRIQRWSYKAIRVHGIVYISNEDHADLADHLVSTQGLDVDSLYERRELQFGYWQDPQGRPLGPTYAFREIDTSISYHGA